MNNTEDGLVNFGPVFSDRVSPSENGWSEEATLELLSRTIDALDRLYPRVKRSHRPQLITLRYHLLTLKRAARSGESDYQRAVQQKRTLCLEIVTQTLRAHRLEQNLAHRFFLS